GWTWGVCFTAKGAPAAYSFFLPAGPASFSMSGSSATVTWTAGGGLMSLPAGTGVKLSGNSLPGGFSAGTTYYVVSSSGLTVELATTPGGSAVTAASAGSGSLTVVQRNLSSLTPVASAPASVTAYLQLPAGTPADGDTIVATGPAAWEWGTAGGDVSSVFGRTGAVTAEAGDYTPSQVGADAAGAAAAAQSAAETFATSAVAAETTRAETAEALKMPVPTGTALSGQVPVATGSGNATAWGTVSGGGGSGITSVTNGDASVLVGGTATAITLETATLDVIATLHPPAAAVPFNGKKATGLAHGTVAGDGVAYDQLGTAAFQAASAFDAAGAAAAVAAEAGQPSGLAALDSGGHVPVAQLPAATTGAEGIVQLAADLGGTADAPTVEKIQGTPIAAPSGGATSYLNASGAWTVPAGGGGGGGGGLYTVLTPSTSAANTTAVNSALSALTAYGGVVGLAPGNWEFDGPVVLGAHQGLIGCGGALYGLNDTHRAVVSGSASWAQGA
ncbi:MAG: hypothetical protein ACRDN0_05070, partial [Trebonia sp.]